MTPFVFSCGRCLVGIFPYWIGFSWRRVGGMGRVIDCGLVKVAIAPAPKAKP